MQYTTPSVPFEMETQLGEAQIDQDDYKPAKTNSGLQDTSECG